MRLRAFTEPNDIQDMEKRIKQLEQEKQQLLIHKILKAQQKFVTKKTIERTFGAGKEV